MIRRRDFTLFAETDLANYRLAKLSNGKAAYQSAAPTDVPLGVTNGHAESGGYALIIPVNAEGSVEIEAAGGITAGDDVYAAADGKVQALPAAPGSYRKIGQAIEGANEAGHVIEVLLYDYNTVTTVT